MSVRLLVLPIFRNQWLYHVMEGPPAALQQASRSWQDGKTVQEKLQILGEQVSTKVRRQLPADFRRRSIACGLTGALAAGQVQRLREVATGRDCQGRDFQAPVIQVRNNNHASAAIATLTMSRWGRLAQFLLSREDPLESFFKSLPKDCTSAEIIYPVRALVGGGLACMYTYPLPVLRQACTRCW
jgi:hypothetical protein